MNPIGENSNQALSLQDLQGASLSAFASQRPVVMEILPFRQPATGGRLFLLVLLLTAENVSLIIKTVEL
jgi:hypothetical protein